MKTLGLITARGGSVRCPRKNIANLGGKPLLAWTIEAALRSGVINHLTCSTEDAEVAEAARKFGCHITQRPDSLAFEDTPTMPVVQHAVASCRSKPETVILLQPTSPFRTADDIAKAFDLFTFKQADAVISVTRPPDELVFEIGHAGRLRPSETTFVPNGAIYIIRTECLSLGFYNGITYGYQMPRERSIDIDTSLDLCMARAALEFQKNAAA